MILQGIILFVAIILVIVAIKVRIWDKKNAIDLKGSK
jgi:hypothetical protein